MAGEDVLGKVGGEGEVGERGLEGPFDVGGIEPGREAASEKTACQAVHGRLAEEGAS